MVKADSSAGDAVLDEKQLGVAVWALDHEQIAGRGTQTLPASDWTFIPLRGSRGTVGVLGLFAPSDNSQLSPEERQLMETFASQTALAVERANLADEARAAWERVEAEFLRNTLLSGVSHELRTPLAAITGAGSSLLENGSRFSSEARVDLLQTVVSEAERMERLINNLLDMTRLESGGLAVKKEWQPIQEVIGSALHRFDRRLKDHPVVTRVADDLPLVQIDAVLMEQVLTNLLDNAVEYTPAGTTITVAARRAADAVEVEVADDGPGLPPGTEQRVFEKFFRAGPVANLRGIGLGLAICRGIVEAHGGRITARNRAGGGAAFTFTIPSIAEAPPVAQRIGGERGVQPVA
jgi:two-component system sensor histidine kinase KdpD